MSKKRVIAAAAGLLAACQGMGSAWAGQGATAPILGAQIGAQNTGAASEWGSAPATISAIRYAQAPNAQGGSGRDAKNGAKDARRRGGNGAKNKKRAAPRVAAGPCDAMPAKWSHAESLARSGRADESLAAFEGLLAACHDPKAGAGTAWKAQAALPEPQRSLFVDSDPMRSEAMAGLRSELLVARMGRESQAGNQEAALADSRAVRERVAATGDAGALLSSAWLESDASNDPEAERLFALSARRSPTPAQASSAQMGLALSLLRQKKLDEAQEAAAPLNSEEGRALRLSIAAARARSAADAGHPQEALDLADQALVSGAQGPEADSLRALRGWSLLKLGRAREAQAQFQSLCQKDPNVEEWRSGLAFAAIANRDYTQLEAMAGSALGMGSAEATVAAREAVGSHYERMGYEGKAFGVYGRAPDGQEASFQSLASHESKSGTAGQDRLRADTLAQWRVSMAQNPTLSVWAEGSVARLDDGVRHVWGEEAGVSFAHQGNNGVALGGAALESPGTGPTQALAHFGYRWASESERAFFEVAFARDSVHDSVRSYAGDPQAGTGPALSNTLSASLRAPIAGTAWSAQGNVSAGAVQANGTALNPFYSVDLQVGRDFSVRGWSWLNAGLDVRTGNYRYDANRFIPGFAGYWSPKANEEFGGVFNAQSEEGSSVLFKSSGRAGYARRELWTGRAQGAFVEDTAELAVLVSSRLIVGAGFGARISPGYHDVNAFAWIKIPFDARASLRAADLATPTGF